MNRSVGRRGRSTPHDSAALACTLPFTRSQLVSPVHARSLQTLRMYLLR